MSGSTDYPRQSEDIPEMLEHLIHRDVDTVNFPDRIYALGGGGRKMLIEMFSQDWVALEAMRGRNRDISLIFIDTATENTENHAEEVDKLQSRLDSLEQTFQEETSADSTVGSIKIEEQLITEDLHIRTRASLTGDDTVQQIKSYTDADNWWLHREHLNSTDKSSDFYNVSKGAIKRRALGKAIHYKAYAQGGRDYKDSLKTTAEEDDIAIFTGLGGGTGSGIFIDIAQEIKDRNADAGVNLFATLPTSYQRDETRANAFAALSEIEHLNLTGKSPFNDVFLFPLEPTGLQTEATQSPELAEFDRAAVYAVMGVYNSDDRDYALSNQLSFSPFTIAVPQVLRYSRDEIKRKKSEIKSILEKKRKLLNLEYYFLEKIEEHINDNYPNSGINSDEIDISEEAREYLIDRLRRFEQLITSNLLEELEVEITEKSSNFLGDIYGDGLDPSENTLTEVFRRRSIDDVMTDIEFIKENYSMSGGRVDSYAEFGNPFIEDIVYTELCRITELFDLMRRLRSAEKQTMVSSEHEVATDADTKLIETFLVPELSRADKKDRWKALNTIIEGTSSDLEAVNKDIESAQQQKQAEEEKYNDLVNEYFHSFWQEIRPIAEDYEELLDVNANTAIKNLETALINYGNKIDEKGPDAASEADVREAVSELEHETDVDLNTDHKISIESLTKDIDKSISNLKRAHEEWQDIKSNENDSGILSGFFGNNKDSTLDVKEYRKVERSLDNAGIFEVPRAPNTQEALNQTTFFVDSNRDIKDKLESHIKEVRNSVKNDLVETYKRKLENINEEESESPSIVAQASAESDVLITDTLQAASSAQISSEVKADLRDDIRSRIGTDITQYESEINRLQDRKAVLEDRHRRLRATKELYGELTERVERPFRDIYAEYQSKFDSSLFDIPNQRATRHAIQDLYRQVVTPADLSSAIKSPSLAETDLLTSPSTNGVSQERQDIRKSITRIINNRVLENQYNGLERLRLRTADKSSYEQTGIYVAFGGEATSNSVDADRKLTRDDFKGAEDSLKENFDLADEANQYDHWFIENGDPWEVSMCVYIQGISFLDNLRDVIETTNGYWSRYQGITKGRSTSKIIERHSYGLEKGFYTTRSRLIDINGNPEFFLEQSNKTIREQLIDIHNKEQLERDSADVNFEMESDDMDYT